MNEKSKEKLKSRIKVATASSPAVAAMFLFPTETFAFLKMLKEAGLELPSILFIAGIAWWLRKDVIRICDGRLGDLNTTVSGVRDDLRVANEQNSKQFLEGAKVMQIQGQQIRFIMTHLQLNSTDQMPPEEVK